MRIGGLASGMDIDQIVKDLMAAEKMPLDKLNQQKVWTEWQQEAYREFNLAFKNLQTSANSLRFTSAFNAYSATSSNQGSVGVTTTSTAMKGTYEIEVKSLASSAKLTSTAAVKNAAGNNAAGTDVIGTAGTISVTSNGVTREVPITADMTFSAVAKKIQDSTAGGVPELRASFDNTTSRFFMSTKGMGADQNFSLTFDSPELAAKVETPAGVTTSAKDGSISFDGVDVTGLKSNQTVVNGLTINLNSIGTSTVTVQTDTAKPVEAIKKFVEDYNKTIADIENKLIEKRYPDFQPLSDEERNAMSETEVEMWEKKSKSGLLRNDPLLRGALQDLRRAFMDPVDDLENIGNLSMLSQVGINTGHYSEGGKLKIDEDKLNKMMAEKPDEVMNLFTKKTGTPGIFERVYKELDTVVRDLSNRAGSQGSFVDKSSLTKKINQMNDDINKWQDRLIRLEDRYWNQFSAMEKALNQMNQQSMWMQQNMFGGM
ncbi:flagellar filament capping protein FliD [Planomicrobium sp. MB-3u-38]|uniref:flagellar filament capping protein FliD n=1 Tax=Planomicrobium sp. MB-3u-38 TaxID=2058318 RepID=UPI000C7A0B7D|nr:flagellar filament capping protein FliD [Planomicrobium sp. MB-3u-38]PKH10368.1 flagellar cap protein [Planomicrobium sp. MB-3u-38]